MMLTADEHLPAAGEVLTPDGADRQVLRRKFLALVAELEAQIPELERQR